jgi:hypothetical protein
MCRYWKHANQMANNYSLVDFKEMHIRIMGKAVILRYFSSLEVHQLA